MQTFMLRYLEYCLNISRIGDFVERKVRSKPDTSTLLDETIDSHVVYRG